MAADDAEADELPLLPPEAVAAEAEVGVPLPLLPTLPPELDRLVSCRLDEDVV